MTTGQSISVSKPKWLVKAEAEADRRFATVQWQDGNWYGLYEEDQGPATQQFYRCEIDGDQITLVEDQYNCDRHLDPDAHDARSLFSSATVVVAL